MTAYAYRTLVSYGRTIIRNEHSENIDCSELSVTQLSALVGDKKFCIFFDENMDGYKISWRDERQESIEEMRERIQKLEKYNGEVGRRTNYKNYSEVQNALQRANTKYELGCIVDRVEEMYARDELVMEDADWHAMTAFLKEREIGLSKDLASLWNAVPATDGHSGVIVAASTSEVIQHIGRNNYVVWPTEKLVGEDIHLGRNVDIGSNGLVRKRQQEKSLAL